MPHVFKNYQGRSYDIFKGELKLLNAGLCSSGAPPFTLVEGGAGTGKTSLLQLIVKEHPDALICSPTGIAANAIQGQTIHSLFSLIPSSCPVKSQIHWGKVNARALPLKEPSLVIIDEVSMVRSDVMDAIDYALKVARNSSELFGGAKVVAFGDLFQLPPVARKGDIDLLAENRNPSPWFFHSRCLNGLPMGHFPLTQNFRQSGDLNFTSILNRIRVGLQTDDDLKQLNKRVIQAGQGNDLKMPYLAPHVREVQLRNDQASKQVSGKSYRLVAKVSGDYEESEIKKAFIGIEGMRSFEVKIGAKYMLTRNQPQKGYYNGTIGVLTGVLFDSRGEVEQLSLQVKGQTRPLRVDRELFDVSNFGNRTCRKIEQFPLILAYAQTIHKAQGMTLQEAEVDFSRSPFEAGHAYVALSRVTSLHNLHLTAPITHNHIQLDQRVVNFMQWLEAS